MREKSLKSSRKVPGYKAAEEWPVLAGFVKAYWLFTGGVILEYDRTVRTYFGVLTENSEKREERMSEKRLIRTMCPMNCLPTQCGMRVEVEGNQLLSVKGDEQHPESRGFLCIRGRATREIPHNPARLLTPIRRKRRGEDAWEPCSWDDAYTMIVEAIERTQRDRVGLWRGHGVGSTGINTPLITRFGSLGGFQHWVSAIVCWALGGYGLGLTGVLKTNTKVDMAAHSRMVFFWGATLASQPGTSPYLVAARKRGAYVVHIDTRRTEASRHADEVVLIRPGTDAALALAMAHVIVEEGLTDQAFVQEYTLGFAEFADHLRQYTPEWGARQTGIDPEQIRHLARLYATRTPAMIVLGGSSMYKHQHGWEASRAIACLPALTGQLGIAGGGLGPRHGATAQANGLADVTADVVRPQGSYIPSHMASITEALTSGSLDVLLLLGANFLSGFADSNTVERGLEKVGLIVSYDIFMNETIRRVADLVLPGTIWLEELGLKQTATHLYLMEPALQPVGEVRPLSRVLRELAERLDIPDVFPWQDDEAYINALLSTQKLPSGEALTVAELRKQGGYWQKTALSEVAYPDRRFDTPSKKVEFWSERALQAGLSPLPSFTPAVEEEATRYPLRFCQGRTLTAFHSFYDEGKVLPTLAKANPEPEIWLHPNDARPRKIETGNRVLISNGHGHFEAKALVTEGILQGVVWMRDGWSGVNRVTSGQQTVPLVANDIIADIPGGQATYDAWVDLQNV
ncbi:anaerobic selenocysteine-containing dehydrogenase [Thermosporothrix hazakensis]|uniref:Anaerobic selenocysteine-containing dehydrogenase n=2 Tax=Thermosporothrix TaxID=768650 RepID=A0A326UB70_THEHA|nr:anaerobic selenocysteine-containing dehydrogenase [Thermosporothrix hazakensis]